MLNNEQLLEFIESHEFCIIQYGSETCNPCVSLHYKLETQKDIPFQYVSVDENRELCAQRNILTVPALQFFADGKCMLEKSGYFSLDEFLDRIDWILDKKRTL